jgi:23S rRNA (uracil1939-C5)-methyltransferase
VLELHAGVGNFTLPLARDGAHVVAAEHNRRAVVLARRNARALGRDVAVHDETDTAALRHAQDAELLLIDPPRTGARSVAEAVAETKLPRIVYVSCDSATFARDASILARAGFALASIEAFDMFPQTPHVETIALLERA